MPNKTEIESSKKGTKKMGLGRGLGSLLGGDEGSFSRHRDQTQHSTFDNESSPFNEGFIEGEASQTAGPQPEISSKSSMEKSQKASPKIPDHARIWQIPIDKLAGNPKQPRQNFEKEKLQELASSIKTKGILQPIVARRLGPEKFEIIAGERRWRAAQMAGIHEVPVILRTSDNQNALELALIENLQREDLNPVEEAEAYAHLMKEYSLTQQQLAEKTGKERATIANMLRLLNLLPPVRNMLAAGQISLGQAKILLSLNNPEKQKNIAEEIRKKKLTVRDTERLVAQANKTPEDAQEHKEARPSEVSDRLIQILSQDLQKLLGTRVAIDYSQGKGRVKIHFYSDAELNNIVERVKEAWKK